MLFLFQFVFFFAIAAAYDTSSLAEETEVVFPLDMFPRQVEEAGKLNIEPRGITIITTFHDHVYTITGPTTLSWVRSGTEIPGSEIVSTKVYHSKATEYLLGVVSSNLVLYRGSTELSSSAGPTATPTPSSSAIPSTSSPSKSSFVTSSVPSTTFTSFVSSSTTPSSSSISSSSSSSSFIPSSSSSSSIPSSSSPSSSSSVPSSTPTSSSSIPSSSSSSSIPSSSSSSLIPSSSSSSSIPSSSSSSSTPSSSRSSYIPPSSSSIPSSSSSIPSVSSPSSSSSVKSSSRVVLMQPASSKCIIPMGFTSTVTAKASQLVAVEDFTTIVPSDTVLTITGTSTGPCIRVTSSAPSKVTSKSLKSSGGPLSTSCTIPMQYTTTISLSSPTSLTITDRSTTSTIWVPEPTVLELTLTSSGPCTPSTSKSWATSSTTLSSASPETSCTIPMQYTTLTSISSPTVVTWSSSTIAVPSPTVLTLTGVSSGPCTPQPSSANSTSSTSSAGRVIWTSSELTTAEITVSTSVETKGGPQQWVNLLVTPSASTAIVTRTITKVIPHTTIEPTKAAVSSEPADISIIPGNPIETPWVAASRISSQGVPISSATAPGFLANRGTPRYPGTSHASIAGRFINILLCIL